MLKASVSVLDTSGEGLNIRICTIILVTIILVVSVKGENGGCRFL